MEQIHIKIDKNQAYTFAMCICSDVLEYVKNHKKEYEEFLLKENDKNL